MLLITMNEEDKEIYIGMITLIIILVLNCIFGALLWPYVFEKWYLFFGRSIDMFWWHGALIGLVPYIGGLCIPAAIITYIFFLFI